jgi:hypothetical protein
VSSVEVEPKRVTCHGRGMLDWQVAACCAASGIQRYETYHQNITNSKSNEPGGGRGM